MDKENITLIDWKENIKKLRELTGVGIMDVKKALIASDQDIDKAVIWLKEANKVTSIKKINHQGVEGKIFIRTFFDNKQKFINNDNKIIRVVMFEITCETDFVARTEAFNKMGYEIMDIGINGFDDEYVNIRARIVISIYGTIFKENISLKRNIEFSEIDGWADKNQTQINFGTYVHSNGKIGVILSGYDISKDVLNDIAMHIAAMDPKYLSVDDIPQIDKDNELELIKVILGDSIKNKPEQIQEKILKGKLDKVFSANTLLEQTFVKDKSKKIKDIIGDGKIVKFIRYEVGEVL